MRPALRTHCVSRTHCALRPSRALLILAALCVTLLAAAPSLASPTPSQALGVLEARHIGPVGNRVITVAGVPGDPNVAYVGAASGGIWKTEDWGTSWRPIFDDQPASSVGALAVAPSDPNVVWAGTGETFIRANISIGNGVYRSTDAGETWTHLGLTETGRIGRIVVHPDDPDTAWVAALGHVYGPQPERGIYRTRDGGTTWEHVLFVDEDTGASDLVIDPNNPRILFAGTWSIEVNTWSRTSGGSGSGLWRSRDGGTTWDRLDGNGLPDRPWGKVGLTLSAADSKRVYALIETSSNRDFAVSDPFQGVLWRSDDGGNSWRMVSADNNLVQRPLYYSRALAAPHDANTVYFMAVRHSTSLDGGLTNFATASQPGYDHHDMWIDPENPQRMLVGHDGGVSLSTNGGKSWAWPQLPIAQMYHVAVDDQVPYYVYGNRQDGPTMRGPSNTLDGGDIPIGAWREVGGCEVGFTLPTPGDPDMIWSGCYDGILELYDHRNRQSRNVSVWPEAIESWPAIDLRYRFQWTFPMAISPHDPNTVYVGSQFVHRTTTRGQGWEVISPDLTSNDPELQQRTGGLTLDDAGPTLAPTLFAIAESKLEPGVIWTGSNDGLVQVTRDGGANWTDTTANLPEDLPPRGTISNVEPSRHAAGAAYITVDRHQLGDTATWAYKTEDYGATWRSLRGDLPQDTFAYAHCLREDPKRPGLLYLGTENAVWVSFDDGSRWHKLGGGFPHTPVHWLTIQEHFDDLVIATYGRGFWIVDDITPLRSVDASETETMVQLLEPRDVYRFRDREPRIRQPADPAAGENPSYGAAIHYVLGESDDPSTDDDGASDGGDTVDDSAGDKDSGAVELDILDADGRVIRTLEDLPSKAGFHRIQWNLRGETTKEVKLRTKPAENPHIEIPDKGWRSLSDGGRLSLLVPPGTYTLRLRARGETVEQSIEVLKDPHSTGTLEDIRAQYAVLDELWTLVDDAAGMINSLEGSRRQLQDLRVRLEEGSEDDEAADGDAEDGDAEEVVQGILDAAEELEEELEGLEGRFFDLRLTGARQDSLRWKRLLYSRLTYLAWGIAGSDHRPTDQQVEVFQLYREQMEDYREMFDEFETKVEEFNRSLTEAGLAGIITHWSAP